MTGSLDIRLRQDYDETRARNDKKMRVSSDEEKSIPDFVEVEAAGGSGWTGFGAVFAV